jgi:tetratricopeptide (TPR) repeat protein
MRGPQSKLFLRCAQITRGLNALYLYQAKTSPRSWGAVRNLVHQLRLQLGGARYQEIVHRHAAVVRLLLPGEQTDSAESTPTLADALAAQPTSHMTHNFVLQHPIAEAAAALLIDLMADVEPTLVVPGLEFLTLEDAFVLKAIYRRHAACAPSLLLGFDPTFRNEPDDQGILWGIPQYHLLKIATDFQLIPGSRSIELPASPVEPQSSHQDLQQLQGVEEGFDHLEAQAWRVLNEEKSEISEQEASLVAAAVRAIFRAFGFTSALRLGLAVLPRRPNLSARDAADVNNLLALAAHNRQFATQDNRALAQFLVRHFSMALASEDRPAQQAALHYRLAVMHGRRLKDFDAALEYANRAIAIAVDLPRQQAVYQGAWAHNIRAYVHMRTRRFREAEQDTLAAFDLVDRHLSGITDPTAVGGQEEMWLRDLRSSASLFAHNTRNLLLMSKRPAADLLPWMKRSNAAIAVIPSMERFETISWTDQFLRESRLDLALEATLRGLADAQQERDAVREYDHAIMAANLYYQLGRADEAHEAFEQVQVLRARCLLPRLLAVDVMSALALAHGGKLEEARMRLVRLLGDRHPELGLWAQVELRAHLIGVLARLGLHHETEQAVEEAIELAKASGERKLLLQVAVAAGRSCQSLKLEDWARQAYEQALAIAETGGPDASPPSAAQLLGALLGRHETGALDPAIALRALDCAQAALKEPEPWWDLPRLLACLQSIPLDALRATDKARALDQVLLAAQSREDCSPFFQAFSARWPQSQQHLAGRAA